VLFLIRVKKQLIQKQQEAITMKEFDVYLLAGLTTFFLFTSMIG